jgi:hypothetical protein
MTDNPASPPTAGRQHASPEELVVFRRAYSQWLRDPIEFCERDVLLASLPLLRAVQKSCVGSERGALDIIAAALEDRLNGWGWSSLTHRQKGQGLNYIQRVAIKYAFDYIAAAKSGRIRDTDSVGAVCRHFSRRGDKPLPRDSLSRWRRRHHLPEGNFSRVFEGEPEEATERAQDILTDYAHYLHRCPSDTSP